MITIIYKWSEELNCMKYHNYGNPGDKLTKLC